MRPGFREAAGGAIVSWARLFGATGLRLACALCGFCAKRTSQSEPFAGTDGRKRARTTCDANASAPAGAAKSQGVVGNHTTPTKSNPSYFGTLLLGEW